MVFRSKVDMYFMNFVLIVILIIALAMFLPLYFEGGNVLIVTFIFLIFVSFLLWNVFSIKYVFYQDHLLVKGGMFRSRISYENITKVSPTTKIFVGYKLLSSKDAIEIFYKTASLGSVKISPRNKKEFISELKKRCPNIQFQEQKYL